MIIIYNVLIVDDEMYSRMGIRQFIVRNLPEYKIAGEASDGFKAIEFCKLNKVDIVITDIRMPKIDGIELAEHLGEIMPKVQVIIITGFSLFEYAQKAVKLQTIDFILKPVQESDLVNAVIKAAAKLEKINHREKTVIEDLIKNIVAGKEKNEALEEYFSQDQELEMAIVNTCGTNESFDPKDSLTHLGTRLMKVKLSNKEELFIYPGEVELKTALEEALDKAKQKKNYFLFMSYTHRAYISELYEQFIKLNNLINDSFYQESNILTTEVTPIKINQDTSLVAKNINGVLRAFKGFSRNDLKTSLNSMFKYFSDSKTPPEIVQENLIEIKINLIMQYESIDNTILQGYESEWKKSNIPLKAVKTKFERYIVVAQDIIKENQPDNYFSPIKEAIDYVDNNFEQKISLETVAKKVHLNSSYLSRAFREYAGVTFSQYLLEKKMSKALELLKENKTISEVSNQLGYENYKTFSTRFKQYYGITPSEHQNLKP